MTIVWDAEKMSTGVQLVDEEHQEWIRYFNEFEEAIVSGAGFDAVQRILEFVIDYSERHFVHEELLSCNLTTPAVRLNQFEHNNFRLKIQEMRDWIMKNGVSSVEVLSLQVDLENWLVRHICNVDVLVWLSENSLTQQLFNQSADA